MEKILFVLIICGVMIFILGLHMYKQGKIWGNEQQKLYGRDALILFIFIIAAICVIWLESRF